MTTMQVLVVVGTRTSHVRSQHQVFKHLFMQSDDEVDTVEFNNFGNFQSHLLGLKDKFEKIDQYLFQATNMSTSTFALDVYHIEQGINQAMSKINFNISNMFPLSFCNVSDLNSLKEKINQISQISLTVSSILTRSNFGRPSDKSEDTSFCTNWTLYMDYNFDTFARIVGKFDSEGLFCNSYENFGQSYLFVHFGVLILASISLFLSWKSIYEMAKDYMQYMFLYKNVKTSLQSRPSLKNQGSQEEEEPLENLLEFKKSWEELSFFDKLKFFDFWFVFSILGNFIQINGSIIAILFIFVRTKLSIFLFHEAIIGFGCMFSWLLILKYLEYNPNINLMTSTLSKSGSTLAIFLLGVLPFYLAYVFLGQCLFWKTTKFQDTNHSVVTLFALSFGDVVNETFQNTKESGILGEIFLITFMLLFYTAVQNVFITIIMDGYEKSKREKKGKGGKVKEEIRPNRPTLPPVNPPTIVLPTEPPGKEKISFIIEEDKLVESQVIKRREEDEQGLIEEEKEEGKENEPRERKNEIRKKDDLDDFLEISFEKDTIHKIRDSQDSGFIKKKIETEEEESKGQISPQDSRKGGKRDSHEDDFTKTMDRFLENRNTFLPIVDQKEPFSPTLDKKDESGTPILKPPLKDKDKILNKLKIHVTQIEKILENLSHLANDIETIEFVADDKMYLIETYRENLEDIEKEVKYQINNYIK